MADSVGYFLDNLDRISRREYEPTHQDILYARRTTKEVTEFRIPINNLNFVFVDVGGQRSQREKWFKLFCQGTYLILTAVQLSFQSYICNLVFAVTSSPLQQIRMHVHIT